MEGRSVVFDWRDVDANWSAIAHGRDDTTSRVRDREMDVAMFDAFPEKERRTIAPRQDFQCLEPLNANAVEVTRDDVAYCRLFRWHAPEKQELCQRARREV